MKKYILYAIALLQMIISSLLLVGATQFYLMASFIDPTIDEEYIKNIEFHHIEKYGKVLR